MLQFAEFDLWVGAPECILSSYCCQLCCNNITSMAHSGEGNVGSVGAWYSFKCDPLHVCAGGHAPGS